MERFSHLEAVFKSAVDRVKCRQKLKLLQEGVQRPQCKLFETFCEVAAIRMVDYVERVHEPVEAWLRYYEYKTGSLSGL